MNAAILAEFLGTMVLILFGAGVCAGVNLEKSFAKGAGWIVITAGWAFAVTLGVFVSKAFGGPGALNPVGPLADMVQGKLAYDQGLGMIAAEFLGAICGATLVWIHYYPHWEITADPSVKRGVFCNTPAIRHTPANLASEIIGTAALVFCAGAIGKASIGGLEPTMTGLLIWAIGLSLGGTTGYAINPARDLGPRIAHAILPIAGKGPSGWDYAWIPVVGPVIGGLLGALALKALNTLN